MAMSLLNFMFWNRENNHEPETFFVISSTIFGDARSDTPEDDSVFRNREVSEAATSDTAYSPIFVNLEIIFMERRCS